MNNSEENSAVDSDIILIQSKNWHGEIGIVETSFSKVEHFLTVVS